MGGEDSRAAEEDSAFLSLIMSDVIWREKQEVDLATHISLAEFQRREMIQREGRPCPVSLFQTPSTAGRPVSRCPKDSHLTKQRLPREGGDWLQVWGERLLWMRRDCIRDRRCLSDHNLASLFSPSASRPRSLGPVPKCVLGTGRHPIPLLPQKRIWSVT